ncbi:MAG: MoaD/ThiS family protein [Chloroflexota bacterium]
MTSILLTNVADRQTVEVSGSTVGECLRDLTARYPDIAKLVWREEGDLQDYLYIYVNQKKTDDDNILSRPVRDGDEIHVIVLIEGG